MSQTHGDIRDMAEQILNDTGNATWATTELDLLIIEALREASRFAPRECKETRKTTASSFDIDISEVVNLIEVDYAEYKVDKNPQERRNVSTFGGTLTLDLGSRPSSALNAYLFCRKHHVLVTDMDDKTGAVDNGSNYAAGDTSIVLDALGTGTIPKNALVTFASTIGEYRVTADATITANAATIIITPGLLEAVVDNVVVTFVCTTLTEDLEWILPILVAGKAAVNYGRSIINSVNIGGTMTPREIIGWGENKIAMAYSALHRIGVEGMKHIPMYPRD